MELNKIHVRTEDCSDYFRKFNNQKSSKKKWPSRKNLSPPLWDLVSDSILNGLNDKEYYATGYADNNTTLITKNLSLQSSQ